LVIALVGLAKKYLAFCSGPKLRPFSMTPAFCTPAQPQNVEGSWIDFKPHQLKK
jgi:hypothetical protein